MLIEEMNKFVRRKRIGDKDWQTYAEAERIPQLNEKCFCLEPKSRKWLRAKIVSLDNSKALCKVRYLDTGNLETNFYTFDSLMVWKEFELSRIAPRAIRCVLHKSRHGGDPYEKDIGLETKFLFKDLTARQNLKCVLVEPLARAAVENKNDIYINESEDQTWVVKLYKPGEYRKLLENGSLLSKDSLKDDNNNLSADSGKTMDSKPMYERNLSVIEPKSINDLISEQGEQERKHWANKSNPQSAFNSADIRVKAGQVEASFNMVKTGRVEQDSTEPQQQQQQSSKIASSHSIGEIAPAQKENSQNFEEMYKSLQFVPGVQPELPVSTSKQSIAETSKSNVTLEISESNDKVILFKIKSKN
jgi:hypothetical protein